MSMTDAVRDRLRIMRGNMAVMTITQTLGMFGRSLAFPYASLFILALGGEPEQVGLVNSLAPLLGLLMFPIGGYLADHTGRVKILVSALLFQALTGLMYVFAPSWELILVAGIIRGVLVVQFPASSAIIADSLAPEDRGRGLATMNMIAGLPALLAPYAAGALIELTDAEVGMRLLYAAMVFTNSVSALIHLRYLRDTNTPSQERIEVRDLLGVVKSAYQGIPELVSSLPRSLRYLFMIVLLGFVSNAIAGPYWVVYAIDHIGLGTSQWGLILLIETLLRNLTYIFSGHLVDRCGRSNCLRFALGLIVVALPMFVLARGFWPVLAIRAAVAVANAFSMPASTALMADTIPRENRGRVMAAIGRGSVMLGAAAGGTGGPGLGYLITLPLMAASFASGYIYSANATMPWLIAGGLALAALLLAMVAVRDPQKAQV